MCHTTLSRLDTCARVVPRGLFTQPSRAWRISRTAKLCTTAVVVPTTSAVVDARRMKGFNSSGANASHLLGELARERRNAGVDVDPSRLKRWINVVAST